MRLLKIIFILLGTLSLTISLIGIYVPGLPTMPFLLLSAFLYAKSSEKLYNKLVNNRITGKYIADYLKYRGITKKTKLKIIILMNTMVAISTFFFIPLKIIKIIVVFSGFIGNVVVWFFVPTINK